MGSLFNSAHMCDDGIENWLDDVFTAFTEILREVDKETAGDPEGPTEFERLEEARSRFYRTEACRRAVRDVDAQIEKGSEDDDATSEAWSEGNAEGFREGLAAAVDDEDTCAEILANHLGDRPCAAPENDITGLPGVKLDGRELDVRPDGLLVCRETRRTFRLTETNE